MAAQPRIPTAADFPSAVQLSIIAPPQGQPAANVLILLHGLGDSHASFAQLGRNLNLPYTACIALRAPTPLPFDLGGFHWGDDVLFDQASGLMEFDTGFTKALGVLCDLIIQQSLVDKCQFKLRDVHLFGYGQGGMLALAAARRFTDAELGGVVTIGGPLPALSNDESSVAKAKTPVIVCYGNARTLITGTKLDQIKVAFSTVQDVRWRRPGDGMPSNRDEMLPIMRFFASRLKSRAGVPEDAVEIS